MTPETAPLAVLILEDRPADALLMVDELRRHGFAPAWERVDTEEDYVARLGAGWDVILADYRLPGFDAVQALVLLGGKGLDIPLIIVSGAIGEEAAVACLQYGAADYLSKDRLGRLGPAVDCALAGRRLREEKRRLEAELRQAQRMEAVGQLAAGLAHEFNNLLTVILGRVEMLLARPALEGTMRRDLLLAHGATQRAAGLTAQIRAFARKQALRPEALDPNAVVLGLERTLRRLLGAPIDLVTRLDPQAGRIRADASQLEHVIVSLATNARDAMPEGGRLTVATGRAEAGADPGASAPGMRPGPHVVLSVSDSGIGMDARTRERVFEPFFTTKGVGQGTGLGLASVHGIVAQHGGHIEVESEPGQGAAFRIYLPAVEGAGVAAREAPEGAV